MFSVAKISPDLDLKNCSWVDPELKKDGIFCGNGNPMVVSDTELIWVSPKIHPSTKLLLKKMLENSFRL